MSVRYRLLRSGELDQTLVEAWRGVQSGNAVFASPYFCPEFTQAVGKVRDDVRVVVIENDGRIAGFFPHQHSFPRMGRPVAGPLSDYHGVIAGQECNWSLDEMLSSAGLSVWAFDHLVVNSTQFEPYVTTRAASPQIDLAAGYEGYVQACRAAGSRYIPKAEGLARKLEREQGKLTFKLHDAGNTLEQVLSWKSAQYLRSGIVDVFASRWTRELLQNLSRIDTPDFAGVCSGLRAGDRLIAAHVGMRSRHVLHYWFPAYDPEFAKYSTGIILLLRIAEAAAALGVRLLDLGKGDEQYKERLMSRAVELREGAVELPSLLSNARRLRRSAEARAARGGFGTILGLPLRALRRFERLRKFR